MPRVAAEENVITGITSGDLTSRQFMPMQPPPARAAAALAGAGP